MSWVKFDKFISDKWRQEAERVCHVLCHPASKGDILKTGNIIRQVQKKQ